LLFFAHYSYPSGYWPRVPREACTLP
jgi:hypothetical protein